MTMFLLQPAYKDYLWGGSRLRTEYGKNSPNTIIAESWELSVHPDGRSVIASGADAGRTLADYLAEHPKAAGGAKGEQFPVLAKLIDAQRPLSVQVHPEDDYAYRKAGERGKTELWHILEAEPDAYLYLGVNRTVSKEEFTDRIADNTVEEILKKVPVLPGESYYVPAGTLHAIGKGIVLFEVQETSNQTYRVYDYGRRDANGNLRPLHIADALAVARLSPSSAVPPGYSAWKTVAGGTKRTIVQCPFFTLCEIQLAGTMEIDAPCDSFVHILTAAGNMRAENMEEGSLSLEKGSGLLLLAGEKARLTGNARLLLTSRGK